MKTILTIFLLFASLTGFTQNLRITGTVYAKEDSLPIPGVSVKIKGTPYDVKTDTNGKYTFSVPVGGILVFSFVGYTAQEIKIAKKRNTIDVYLPLSEIEY
jgi:CarboxypepD_reg-like domain